MTSAHWFGLATGFAFGFLMHWHPIGEVEFVHWHCLGKVEIPENRGGFFGAPHHSMGAMIAPPARSNVTVIERIINLIQPPAILLCALCGFARDILFKRFPSVREASFFAKRSPVGLCLQGAGFGSARF